MVTFSDMYICFSKEDCSSHTAVQPKVLKNGVTEFKTRTYSL